MINTHTKAHTVTRLTLVTRFSPITPPTVGAGYAVANTISVPALITAVATSSTGNQLSLVTLPVVCTYSSNNSN